MLSSAWICYSDKDLMEMTHNKTVREDVIFCHSTISSSTWIFAIGGGDIILLPYHVHHRPQVMPAHGNNVMPLPSEDINVIILIPPAPPWMTPSSIVFVINAQTTTRSRCPLAPAVTRAMPTPSSLILGHLPWTEFSPAHPLATARVSPVGLKISLTCFFTLFAADFCKHSFFMKGVWESSLTCFLLLQPLSWW